MLDKILKWLNPLCVILCIPAWLFFKERNDIVMIFFVSLAFAMNLIGTYQAWFEKIK